MQTSLLILLLKESCLLIKIVVGISADKNCGWNFRTGELSDLFNSGVIDPVKVTRTALQNAASCAGTLITTNFGIIQTE
jgi:chaperonin GroEL (HSP60 family)